MEEVAQGLTGSALERVAAGDVEAVQECIDRYGALVWSLARRMCRSRADAEDAVQDVFIALWESSGRFDPGRGSEATWVSTIARRRLIDRARRETRERDLLGRAAEVSEPALRRESAAPGDDDVRRAEQAIARLSADEQPLVKLAVHYGLTHEAIARHTGLPLGTVKTRIRRGLLRVREMLGP
jgi:RNA polymerase sigma-70 factor (ECF subfamily)